MTEQAQNVADAATEAATETKSALQSFVAKHPRATRVAGIIAGTTVVLGVVNAIKNRNDGMVTVKVPADDVTVRTDSAELK